MSRECLRLLFSPKSRHVMTRKAAFRAGVLRHIFQHIRRFLAGPGSRFPLLIEPLPGRQQQPPLRNRDAPAAAAMSG